MSSCGIGKGGHMGREKDSICAGVLEDDRVQDGMVGGKRQGCPQQTDWGRFMARVGGEVLFHPPQGTFLLFSSN